MIIYGSKFTEDKTEEYSYRILSKIILCMESGRTLILKDLEDIYGSLYGKIFVKHRRPVALTYVVRYVEPELCGGREEEELPHRSWGIQQSNVQRPR